MSWIGNFFQNVKETIGEKTPADLNSDIAKMSDYIIKTYNPKARFILMKGLKINIENDLNRTVKIAEETKDENLRALDKFTKEF